MEGAATENAASPVDAAAPAPAPAVDTDQPVEGATVEDSATRTVAREAGVDSDQVIEDAALEDEKHRDQKVHVGVSPEEMRSIIEVIADTGKFWHDWSFLKGLLSLQLKQALAGYSETQTMGQEDGPQQGLLGEAYSELVNRLNDALLRFEEGPPFTLQRLCEILLDPKGTYTKLPKLALALEKNLLVTSTMTKCTDPYPAAHGVPLSLEGAQVTENIGAADAVDVDPESSPESTGSVPNGTEHAGGDGDEEMPDAEAEEIADSEAEEIADSEAEEVPCSRDVEMQEEKPDQVLSVSPDANSDATVTTETVNVSEPSSDPQS